MWQKTGYLCICVYVYLCMHVFVYLDLAKWFWSCGRMCIKTGYLTLIFLPKVNSPLFSSRSFSIFAPFKKCIMCCNGFYQYIPLLKFVMKNHIFTTLWFLKSASLQRCVQNSSTKGRFLCFIMTPHLSIEAPWVLRKNNGCTLHNVIRILIFLNLKLGCHSCLDWLPEEK